MLDYSQYNYKPPLGSTLNTNHPLSIHLMAGYLFNENGGNIAYDFSGNGNHGVLKNGASFLNNSLFLDGVNDYVEVPDANSLSSPNAISIFFRVNSSDVQTRWNDVLGKGVSDTDEELAFWYINSQSWFDVGYPYAATNINYYNNIWYTFTNTFQKTASSAIIQMAYNGSTRSLWQYGNFQFNVTPNSYPLTIGKRWYNSDPNSRTFKGYIDYVMIFNKALTDSEIKSLHENPYQLVDTPSSYKYYAPLNNQLKTTSIPSAEKLGNHIFPGKITISSPSISSAENFGNNKINLNNLSEPKLSSRIDFDLNIKTTNYLPILSPNNITSEVFGTTGSTQYLYKISSCNDDGESLPSNTITINNGNSTLSTSNFIRLTWDLYDFATYYKIYKLVDNKYQLLYVSRNANHFDDIGQTTLSEEPKSINTTGYHPNKLNLGRYIKLYTDKINKSKNYLSTISNQAFYSAYYYASPGSFMIDAYKYSNDITWLFTNQNANSNYVTIGLYEHNTKTDDKYFKGRVYLPRPNNYFDDFFKVSVDRHTSGTISATGSTVTGTNTLWVTDRIAVGARIGFGSKDASLIKTWYQITAITSDTSITIAEVLQISIPANTPYVIEEIRFIQNLVQTNYAAANNGIFITKGVNYNFFDLNNFTVPMATTVDNQRATYILSDAMTSTMYNAAFAFLGPKIDNQTQYMYVMISNTSSNLRGSIYKFNIRASLSGLSSGRSTSGYLYKTLEVDHSPLNVMGRDCRVGCFANVNHSTGKGVNSLYYHYDNRYLFRIPEYSIENGKNYIFERANVVTTVNDETIGLGSYQDMSYDRFTDKFVMGRYLSWRQGNRCEILEFSPTNRPSDGYLGFGGGYGLYRDTMDDTIRPNSYSVLRNNVRQYGVSVEGIYYRTDNNAIYPEIYCADYTLADKFKCFAITPIISCPDNVGFDKLKVEYDDYIGDLEQGLTADTFKIYARTSGMIDDTGAWTLLSDSKNLSSFSASDKIQFKIMFKTIGGSGIYARIHSLTVIYNRDLSFDLKFDTKNTLANSNTIYLNQNQMLNKALPYTIDIYNNDTLYASQSSENVTYGKLETYTNLWTTAQISDKSSSKKIINTNNVFISSQKKNSINSVYLNNSYMSTENSKDYNFDSDFHIEFFYKPFSLSDFGGASFRILSFGGAGRDSGWEIAKETISSVDKLVFYIGNSSANTFIEICNLSELLNDWNRISVFRKDGEICTFLNGTRKNKVTNTTIFNNTTNTFNIGCGNISNPNSYMKGYLDNLFILKGYALNSLQTQVLAPDGSSLVGFTRKTFGSYWNGNLSYFKTNIPTATTVVTNMNNNAVPEYTSYEFFGYLYVPNDQTVSISLANDDEGRLYVGSAALEENYSSNNSLIYFPSASSTPVFASYYATTGYHPFRILTGNSPGPGYCLVTINGFYDVSNFIYTSQQIGVTDYFLLDTKIYTQWNNFRNNSFSKYCVLHLDFKDETNYTGVKRRFVFNTGVLDSLGKVKIKIR
jgi:hypothetical protein